jgi:hypothetical protein
VFLGEDNEGATTGNTTCRQMLSWIKKVKSSGYIYSYVFSVVYGLLLVSSIYKTEQVVIIRDDSFIAGDEARTGSLK